MRIKYIGFVAFWVLVCSPNGLSQEWRGLKPLVSTCEDVRRALGTDKCQYPRSTYRLEKEIVTITYVTCPCAKICYGEAVGWNVPPGTIRSIDRQLSTPISMAEFNVDESWARLSTDMIGHLVYTNQGKGIRLSVMDGEVVSVSYYPPVNKYDHLRCPQCSRASGSKPETDRALSKWSLALENLTLDEEKERLDRFAAKLKEDGRAKGYIIGYGSCQEQDVETSERTKRAKEYVVGNHEIDAGRIVTIYGGRRASAVTELHIRSRRVPAPKTFSSTYPQAP